MKRWISSVIAGGIGMFIATQPLGLTLGLLIGVAVVLLGMITPISILGILLILSPMKTLIATEAPLHLPIDVGQIGFMAFVGFWSVNRIAIQKRLFNSQLFTSVHIPLLIYVIVLALSGFTAISIMDWVTEWFKWIIVLTIVVLIYHMRSNWEWIVFVLIAAGAGAAIIGIYTFLGGSGADHLSINGRFFRAFGTFGQPNPFGGFMGLLAPIAIMMTLGYGWLLVTNHRFDYLFLIVFYAISSLVITTALFMSWSRGAWLGFGISLLVVVFSFPRRLWLSFFLVIAFFSLVGIAWFSGKLPTSITERISSATTDLFVLYDVRAVDITPENYPIVERLAHWQAAINMTQHNPWLGVGIGNYDAAYETYRLINWDKSLGHAHNYYLNVLAETGIIGLAAYAALFMGMIWIAWRTRTRHPDIIARCFVVGFLGMCAYLLTHSLTDNLYVNNIFMHLGVMFGVLAGLHHEVI